jgi:hypothetical protein
MTSANATANKCPALLPPPASILCPKMRVIRGKSGSTTAASSTSSGSRKLRKSRRWQAAWRSIANSVTGLPKRERVIQQDQTRMMIKNQIFKFRETARRQPEIRIRFGAGGQKKQGFV